MSSLESRQWAFSNIENDYPLCKNSTNDSCKTSNHHLYDVDVSIYSNGNEKDNMILHYHQNPSANIIKNKSTNIFYATNLHFFYHTDGHGFSFHTEGRG